MELVQSPAYKVNEILSSLWKSEERSSLGRKKGDLKSPFLHFVRNMVISSLAHTYNLHNNSHPFIVSTNIHLVPIMCKELFQVLGIQ